ncbi:hypothetical protein PBY51_006034 [Eleginops maclovinus]|uniref:Uncharacterized protein n=1 Tax=Eleginops maclovinus TaxID=56733 RepID=A0AAN7WE84_ELEMC|nr:hypothetical protein PBY51_006034 [Eleginops maclovinus]
MFLFKKLRSPSVCKPLDTALTTVSLYRWSVHVALQQTQKQKAQLEIISTQRELQEQILRLSSARLLSRKERGRARLCFLRLCWPVGFISGCFLLQRRHLLFSSLSLMSAVINHCLSGEAVLIQICVLVQPTVLQFACGVPLSIKNRNVHA